MRKLDLSIETITNLAYIAAGVGGLFVDAWIGFCVILLGLASMYSHATKIWWPDWAAMWLAFSAILLKDFPPMYTVGLTALFYAAEQELRKRPKSFGVGKYYILLGLLFVAGMIRSIEFIGFFYAAVYGLTFLIAFIIRQQKDEYSHTIWHVIGGVGLAIYFIALSI